MKRPVVIITGADTLTGLTAVRSLCEYPVSCWGLVDSPEAPACDSRYWSHIELLRGGESDRVSQLIELGRSAMQESDCKPLLVLSQDEWVIRASRYRDRLAETLQFVLPEHDDLMRLMDKTAFQEWAVQQGFPLPAAVTVDGHDTLRKAVEQVGLPCIFKPLVRTPEWDSVYPDRKFLPCDNSRDVDRLLAEADRLFELSPRYILQQWIPGGDEDVVFCLLAFGAEGEVLESFTGRKLWQWPPLGGSTAICTDYDCTDLEELSLRIMRASGVRGLGSVEFKLNRDTMQYLVTEPTVGRNDYQSYVAVRAGKNMTGRLVESVFGVQPASTRRIRGVIWIDELSALRRARVERGGFFKLLWMLSKCLARRKCFLLFDIRDMRPFRKQLGNALRAGRMRPR